MMFASINFTAMRAFPSAREHGLIRKIIKLAWPIAIALLGDTAMGLVDTKLVSGLGDAALGGVGLASMLMYLCYSVASGTFRGVKVLTAHAIGAKRTHAVQHYLWAGLMLAGIYGTLIMLLGRNIRPLLHLFTVRESLIEPAASFFAAVTLAAPTACVQHALIQSRQGAGDSKTPSRVQLAGNVLNGVLAWSLIGGHLGLPRLGVAGAGYATGIAVSVNALFLCALFVRPLPRGQARAVWPAALDVLRQGLPTGAQFALELMAMVTTSVILGGIAPAQLAAHQIALMLLRTSFLPGAAIGEAASVLVGQALGAKLHARILPITRAALVLAGIFMAACGVVFVVFGGAIARAFAVSDDVAHTARMLLLVSALFQIPDAFNIVLRGVLRGAKDAIVPARISIACAWLFIPSLTWFLGKQLQLGALGAWCGFIGETLFASVLLSLRLRYILKTRYANAHREVPISQSENP
jgi:multidrug resistance protein, MATE family